LLFGLIFVPLHQTNTKIVMKNYLFLIFTFVLFSNMSIAQNTDVPQIETQVEGDTTTEAILKQLIAIRNLQEEAKEDRQKIKAEMENKGVELEEVPKNEYGAILQVEHNTRPHWCSDDWNLFGVLSFAVALVAFIVSVFTFRYTKKTFIAQIKTEGNTKKLSQDAQRQLLNDLLRHLYRNYVITYTMRTKMVDIGYKGYPSEEHFEKLKIPMENIHLDAFFGEDEKFQPLHVLYLNLRNYNDEVEVAMKHMINPAIDIATKDEDFDTLEFKVSFLTGKIIDTIYKIWGKGENYKDDMRKAINFSLSGETNATNNIDVPDSGKFKALTLDTLEKTNYSKLFSGDELKKVVEAFNNDVHEERKRNERGSWKVRMIVY